MTCTLCEQPRKPHHSRPGKFYVLCDDHYRERASRISRNWEKTHSEKHTVIRKRYEATPKGKELRKGQSRRYEVKNRESIRAKNRRYKHLRKSATGCYTEIQWQARLEFYGRKCYLCKCDWDSLEPGMQTIDHVIPLSRGGTNWPSNLRPACRSCNRAKSDS